MVNQIEVWRAKQVETASISTETEISSLKANYAFMAEELENITTMLDNRGYSPLFEQGRNGMTLHQVYIGSRQLRELLVGNPIIKRGSELRNAYIWGKGFDIELTMKTAAAKQRVLNLVLLPANQEALFSPEAVERLERSAYTEGNVFYIGDERTKKLTPISLGQISGVYCDPDNHEDIWAIRRTWTRIMGTESIEQAEWVWLNTYDGRRASIIPINDGQPENANIHKTAFVKRYNRQQGWTWGTADALPVIAWSRLYRDGLIDGSVMQSALAKIAFKVTAKTAAGRDKAASVINGDSGPARTAAMTDTMDIAPLATAGKGYDFASLEPLAAVVALGVGLSVDELLGKTPAAENKSLNPSTKRNMRARQLAQAELLREVLVWFGAPASAIEIDFPEIDDQDTYRRFEQLGAAWGTGLFQPEEIRDEMAEVGEIETSGTMPADVLIPNTKATLEFTAKTAAPPALPGGPKPDGSNDMSNGQGRDTQKVGKKSTGDNGLRDGTNKA
jgi:hypothetical protein